MPWLLGLGLAALACGSSSQEGAGATTGPDSNSGSTMTPVDTSGDDEPGNIIAAPDGGSAEPSCDLFEDDCPQGTKCSAYAPPGERARTETRCVPIDSDRRDVDDPCTVTGEPGDGLDDCDAGLTCARLDPSGTGICVPLCHRVDGALECDDPDRTCRKAEGAMQVCSRACNPLDPRSCPDEGQACYTLTGWLTCLTDVSGDFGKPGDPCIFTNACDPGLACRPADVLPGCAGTRCCTPFCDLDASDPDAACEDALAPTCIPWFAEGEAPGNADNVGVCITPV